MATTSPKLLRWFASKNPRWVLVKLLPLLVLLLWGLFSELKIDGIHLLWFVAGLVVWSFFEYATHRWAYHINFKNRKVRWVLEAFHLYHHSHMQDYRVLNAGLLLIYPLATFFWLLAFIFLGSYSVASSFALGLLVYYFFYENVHYYIHYRYFKSGYMAMIQKYHLYHHYAKWNVNFGNTISLWDRVFGTYDRRYKQLLLTDGQQKDFITSVK